MKRRLEPSRLHWEGNRLYRQWLNSCDHQFIGEVVRDSLPPFTWAIWRRGCCMGHRNDQNTARAELERLAAKDFCV